MLVRLSVKNFTVVREVSINLNKGLTAITGETGAGKSITVDALGLCLGDRADASLVRRGASKAEVVAHFDISHNHQAQAWLCNHELTDDEDDNSCFIRRVVSAEGRSKAFVNGTPLSLQQLKQFASLLISIHGQNHHLRLLNDDYQRHILDQFADNKAEREQVALHYQQWREKQTRLRQLEKDNQQRLDRQQLLSYQVSELDELGLTDGEFEQLEAEFKRLSNGQNLLEQAQISVYRLYENEEGNALSFIRQSIDKLADLEQHDPKLQPIIELLNDSSIQLEEATSELRAYCEDLEIDPFRLQQIEERYSAIMSLARKHNVLPEQLFTHYLVISEECQNLANAGAELETLQRDVATARMQYQHSAEALSNSRQTAAIQFASEVAAAIQGMNMPHAQVAVLVNFDLEQAPASHGQDNVEILVSTNPGQPQDRLDKVVSGGELSRIGLAIQVICRDKDSSPTMIFDEVDTGISGPTASIVGNLLRKLGQQHQVMCVTHLPQVAAQAHHQLFVNKTTDGETTESHLIPLTRQDRVSELARLLAGDSITQSAMANANELLEKAESN